MTREEYLKRPAAKAKRGSELPQAKLDETKAAEILRLHAKKQRLVSRLNARYSAKGLAARFGVHVRTIEKVLQREGWIHAREDLS